MCAPEGTQPGEGREGMERIPVQAGWLPRHVSLCSRLPEGQAQTASSGSGSLWTPAQMRAPRQCSEPRHPLSCLIMTRLVDQAGDLSPTSQTRKAQPGEMESHASMWHRARCLSAQASWVPVCDGGHLSSLL